MGFANSPSIATNGLIFAMDQSNIRSYRGPAITNLMQYLSSGSSTAAGFSSVASTAIEDIPGIGPTAFTYNTIQNDYPAVSTNCCPSLFAFNGGQAVTPNTTYTYAIVYKCDSGYTNPNYMYRYEYTASGGAFVVEGGVFNNTNRAYLGNGWYWAWATFTTAATTNWLGYMGAFYYRYSTTPDKLAIAKVLLVQGTYTSLHPRYWPDPASSRTGSNIIYDQTGRNPTLTAANLTFGSDGYFSFNGSTSTLIFPENSDFNTQTVTVEAWCNPTTLAQNGFLFEKGQVNTQYSLFFNSNSTIYWRQGGLSDLIVTAGTYMTAGTWNQIVGTFKSGEQRVYINGNLVASNTATGTTGTNPNGCSIGVYGGFNGARAYYFNGTIANLKVYNRVLSASEVFQNFVALRGRYGI